MHIDLHENHHDEAMYSLFADVREINAIFIDHVGEAKYLCDKNNILTPVAIDYFDGYEKPDVYKLFEKEPSGYFLNLKNVEIENLEIEKDEFKVNIEDISDGWERIRLSFNGIEISFKASYIGREPLSTLVEAVDYLDGANSDEDVEYINISWAAEPGYLNIELRRELKTGKLSFHIEESDEDKFSRHWNIEMDYSLFRNAVLHTVHTVLNKYGILGFIKNWDCDSQSFPMGSLFSILGVKTNFCNDGYFHRSDLQKEISALQALIAPRETTD